MGYSRGYEDLFVFLSGGSFMFNYADFEVYSLFCLTRNLAFLFDCLEIFFGALNGVQQVVFLGER